MRILLTGASGVGKSTLVKRFLEDNPEFYYPKNFIRPMHSFLDFPINENATNESQYASTAYLAHQIITNENIIFDRGIVDYLVWTKMSKNISKKQYKKHKNDFEKALHLHDVIHLYIPIEFEIEDDGYRSLDNEYRKKTDKNIKKFLDKNNIFYETLTGTVDERYEKMKLIIEAQSIF